MEKEKLKIVIVGHIDHGKSTLIGRLLFDTNSITRDKIEEVKKISEQAGQKFNFAYLLDYLQEERNQGITIDTTQMCFSSEKKDYVIIDAPGHVEFIKNMVTGASQAELAILIVDALEGCKEQTKTHAYILSMLGIKNIIVAVNKMDLVSYEEEAFLRIKRELDEFLSTLNLTVNCYVPVSALEKDNVVVKSEQMDWYGGNTLLQCLDTFTKPIAELNKTVLFPIQDVYRIEEKRIMVGRLESGTLTTNDEVTILPSNVKTRIKTIEKFMEKTAKGLTGECIGITTKDSVFMERGHIVCTDESNLAVTDSFQAKLFWISSEKLRIGETAKVQCATQESSMEIKEITSKIDASTLQSVEGDADIIKPLEVCQVVIHTKNPLVVSDINELIAIKRIVILKNDTICGGGIITNVSV